MATYYVHKGVGSDSNNGLSWANAFSSLGKANQVSGNSDTIYVRAGATAYEEQLTISRSGQRWLADDGHQPVINGRYHDGLANFNVGTAPANAYVVKKQSKTVIPGLVKIEGNDNEIDGFKICNSAGSLFVVTGHDNYAHHLRIDFAYATCILVSGDGAYGNLIEDCETSRGSIQRFTTTDAAYFDEDGFAYVSICNAMKQCGANTFRRVFTHHNNGEGLVLAKGSEGCVMEYCVGWNNYHMVFYINNARNATVRFCTAWVTRNPEMIRNDGPTECVVIGDEKNGNQDVGAQFVRGQKVYGNIFVGGKYGIDVRQGSNYVTQLRDAYVGYNTFVAVPGVTVYQARVRSGPRAHENSIFENNIFYSPPNGVNQELFHPDGNPGVRGRNNIIFHDGRTPPIPSWMDGPGNILADPRLVDPRAVITDNGGVFDNPVNGGNNFNVNNYLLTGSSPAVNAAVTTGYPFNNNSGVELARQLDRFGATRTVPDIGGHEYGGAVTNSVTAAFSRNPVATTLTEGTQVTFTNTSFTTGTANITGQTWTVKKAGVTVQTATTTNLSYTFATDGSYTVELVVTATGSLTDNEIITYTVNDATGGTTVTAAFSASPSQTTLNQGTAVTFTDASTVQNGSITGRAWAVLPLPSGAAVATGSGATFAHTFATAGSWRVRLTATATGGVTDVETRDYTVNSVVTPTVDAAFTSSDPDGLIDEGGSVTFTNTSTVANTTISGYVWTVARQGGGVEATYTTTNAGHTFAQAGLYTVTLLANTAAGVSDSAAMTIVVQSQTTEGREMMIVPHQFALATSTGTQTVTTAALGGKTPKGVHLRFIGATAAGTAAAGALWSEGAASANAQWVHARCSADNETTPRAARRYATSAVAMSIDGDGVKTGQAALVRFVPGGMELNVTDAFPAAYLAEAVFYAGDSLQFWAGSTVIGDRDVPHPVTTGIDQDAVYLMSTWAAAEDTADGHADFSRGWVTRALDEFHFRNRDTDGVAPSNLLTRLQPRVASSGDGVDGYAAVDADSFSHNGFSLITHGSSLTRLASMFSFSTGGYAVHLAALDVPAGGTATYTLPFEAQTVQALTSSYGLAGTNPTGQLSGGHAEGQGWYSLSLHGPVSWSGSIAAKDGAATTDTWSLGAAGFRAVNNAGGNLWNGAATLVGNTLTISPATYPANPCRIIVLAVEQAEELGEPGEGPTADFMVISDVDAETGRMAAWFDASISNGNGHAITSYLWQFGDGSTSSAVKPLKVYAFDGSYVVRLTVTTEAGSDTKTVTIVVYPPDAALATPTLVGPIDPATSGGDTENEIDEETASDTHAIRFALAPFLALDAAGVAAFLAHEANPLYALWAWDEANGRVIVKRPNGAHVVIAAASL